MDTDLKDLKDKFVDHYYGDLVRRLFFAGALIMLVALPFFGELIEIPPMVSIFAIVVVGIAAGFTNPRHTAILVLNVIISITALVTFEYYTIDSYLKLGFSSAFLWINQLLSVIFFLALYFSIKTLRGHILSR